MPDTAELEVIKWASQAGGAGALVYLLIRFGPLIESLFGKSKNGNGAKKEGCISWESLIAHCERTHRQNTEASNQRYGSLEKSIEDLRQDLRDARKDLGGRIDRRNGA
jgi:hypothetical protein